MICLDDIGLTMGIVEQGKTLDTSLMTSLFILLTVVGVGLSRVHLVI